MIRKLFPALLLVGSFSYAQIGINSENPNATLDVTGNPGDPFKFDGIIASHGRKKFRPLLSFKNFVWISSCKND